MVLRTVSVLVGVAWFCIPAASAPQRAAVRRAPVAGSPQQRHVPARVPRHRAPVHGQWHSGHARAGHSGHSHGFGIAGRYGGIGYTLGYPACAPVSFGGSIGSFGYGSYSAYGPVSYGYVGGLVPSWPYLGGSSITQVYNTATIGPSIQVHSPPATAWPNPLPHWGPPGIDSRALEDVWREQSQRWNEPVNLAPAAVSQPVIPQSSAQEKLRALELQSLGDERFRRQEYSQAYLRYKTAIALAGDLASPRFRMAFTLVAIGQFERAVDEFRKGLVRDPQWPQTVETLETLYGPDSELVMNAHLHRVSEWVRDEIRDPERLFLLGVMLYCQERPEQASVCFETALRLAGGGEHLKLFLRAIHGADTDVAGGAAVNAADEKPGAVRPQIVGPGQLDAAPPVQRPRGVQPQRVELPQAAPRQVPPRADRLPIPPLPAPADVGPFINAPPINAPPTNAPPINAPPPETSLRAETLSPGPAAEAVPLGPSARFRPVRLSE